MDVPISLGVILATAMSLYQTVRGSEQVYFDAAITLLFFLLVGRALDQRMRQRAASAAENLLGLRTPSTSVDRRRRHHRAHRHGRRRGRACASWSRPASASPSMRACSTGTTEIDESLITGESRPRHACCRRPALLRHHQSERPIEIEATAVADNTLLAEIARLMATAEQARGRYVRLADRAARLYAPAVHILGAATFAGWMLAGHGWERR